MRYHYCPLCGSRLTVKPAGDDGDVPYCTSCDRYWFEIFNSCVIVLVYNEDDEVILEKQAYQTSPYRSFVAGYIQPGETAEACAVREVKEEVGIDLQDLEYVGTFWFAPREQLMHGYIAYAPKQKLVLSKELAEGIWVPGTEAGQYLYPDPPAAAAHGIYRYFLKKRGLIPDKTYIDKDKRN